MLKILILLAFPAIAVGQQKGDNSIMIKGVTFSLVKNSLLDSGYFINQQNEEDGTIVTKERNVDTYRMFGAPMDRFHLVMYIRVKDSIATIRGEYDFNKETNPKWMTLEYWKSKGSVPYHIFGVMDNFSRSFGKPVSYQKL